MMFFFQIIYSAVEGDFKIKINYLFLLEKTSAIREKRDIQTYHRLDFIDVSTECVTHMRRKIHLIRKSVVQYEKKKILHVFTQTNFNDFITFLF